MDNQAGSPPPPNRAFPGDSIEEWVEWSKTESTQKRIPAVKPERQEPGSMTSGKARLRDFLLRHGPFLSVFLFAVFSLSINVNTYWYTSHESNGLVFMTAAINHIRYGLAYTKGQDFFSAHPFLWTKAAGVHYEGIAPSQTLHFLVSGPSQPVVYGHHPPALGLTIAAAFLVFGIHYWVVRAVPMVFTLIALVLLYILTTRLFGRITATIASLLFITFPVIGYYGRDVAHEAPVTAFSLGMLLCYTLWRQDGNNRWLGAMAACVVLGSVYGWPMIYFAWILLAVNTLATRRISWRLASATALVATIMFPLLIAQIAWAANGSLASLEDIFFRRTSSDQMFTLTTWVARLIQFNMRDFAIWGTLALIPALVYIATRIRRDGLTLRAQAVLYFGAAGVAHILIFRQGAYVHDYWQFYLAPFYALAIAWGAIALVTRLWPQDPQRQALVLSVAGSVALTFSFIPFTIEKLYFPYIPTNVHTGIIVTILHMLKGILPGSHP